MEVLPSSIIYKPNPLFERCPDPIKTDGMAFNDNKNKVEAGRYVRYLVSDLVVAAGSILCALTMPEARVFAAPAVIGTLGSVYNFVQLERTIQRDNVSDSVAK